MNLLSFIRSILGRPAPDRKAAFLAYRDAKRRGDTRDQHRALKALREATVAELRRARCATAGR